MAAASEGGDGRQASSRRRSLDELRTAAAAASRDPAADWPGNAADKAFRSMEMVNKVLQRPQALAKSMGLVDDATASAFRAFAGSGAAAAVMGRMDPLWKQIGADTPALSVLYDVDRLSEPWKTLAAQKAIFTAHQPLTSYLGELKALPDLSRMYLAGNVSSAFGDLSAIVGHANPPLPDLGSMFHLQAQRTLADEPSPIGHMVDRIGRGWASLGDRLIGGQVDLAPLMPPSNRLATRAYELDLVIGLTDPEDVDLEVLGTRQENRDQVAEWLDAVDPRLAERWVGMWDRMDQRGADWQSQAANSAVELMNAFLLTLAPDDEVRRWQTDKDAHHHLYQDNGRPTRRLRLLFLGARFRVSRYTIDGLFHAVPDVIKELQGFKHGVHPDEEFETGISLLGEVITVLMPGRRR